MDCEKGNGSEEEREFFFSRGGKYGEKRTGELHIEERERNRGKMGKKGMSLMVFKRPTFLLFFLGGRDIFSLKGGKPIKKGGDSGKRKDPIVERGGRVPSDGGGTSPYCNEQKKGRRELTSPSREKNVTRKEEKRCCGEDL